MSIQLTKQIEEIIARTGWNDSTLLDFAASFISHKELTKEFEDFLLDLEVEENYRQLDGISDIVYDDYWDEEDDKDSDPQNRNYDEYWDDWYKDR